MKKFPLIFTVLWLSVLALMLWAGFWQLRRADEKLKIKRHMEQNLIHQPQTLEQWQSIASYEQVTTAGHFADWHLLMANQIINGQIGYFVFSPFKTEEGIWLLVNRGWVANINQDFSVNDAPVQITGFVAQWPRPGVQLGEQSFTLEDVQEVTYLPEQQTLKLLKSRLCKQQKDKGCFIFNSVIKLDPVAAFGYVREWQLPRMTVEKHRAYAVQWFSMSFVLCLIYAVFLRKVYASKN